ncbi:DUF6415 family natural product biosynthesis protein [Streptomyces sp. NPDC059070]|uniref:DUF6415 family natural product biosynthesis protein n=1 Tax=Streptomyces sp. NPDC059070 TaxID=3346713 RepID=UPI003683EAEE
MHTNLTRRTTAITDWLASAHPAPATARGQWTMDGLAMLPTGRAFDTVRISAEIVHAAAQSGDSDAVAAYLAHMVDGPVIHDAYAASVSYYVLVPLGSCSHLNTPDAQRLAPDTTWLGVPAVHRTERPGPYWICPPRRREDYCVPAGVDGVIRLGRRRAAAPQLTGPIRPDLARIARECGRFLDGAPARADTLTLDDATARTLRYRGHLMVLLPALQDAEARLPVDDPSRSRVLLGVTEAHRQLGMDSESDNLSAQYAHAQRLARCCVDTVQLLRRLGEHPAPR